VRWVPDVVIVSPLFASELSPQWLCLGDSSRTERIVPRYFAITVYVAAHPVKKHLYSTPVEVADQVAILLCRWYHITRHNTLPTSLEKALSDTFQIVRVGRTVMPDSFHGIAQIDLVLCL
jgi:hypothetical protein